MFLVDTDVNDIRGPFAGYFTASSRHRNLIKFSGDDFCCRSSRKTHSLRWRRELLSRLFTTAGEKRACRSGCERSPKPAAAG
jgi:hypothetical protein